MISNWISVEDRLPEKKECETCWCNCLCSITGRQFQARAYYAGGPIHPGTDRVWFGYHDPQPTLDVTHWMPLPEPPE